MNRRLGLFVFTFAFVLMLAGLASAYSDFSNTYYEKRSLGPNGYQYVQRESSTTPWGEHTSYTKIRDAGYDPYTNSMTTYWRYGPTPGYSVTHYYKNYDYGGYLDYYAPYYSSYRPYYNGQYFDWSHCTTFDCRW